MLMQLQRHTGDLHCPPFLGAQLTLSSSKVTVHVLPLTLKVSVRVKSVLELTWKDPERPFLPLSLPRSSLRISTEVLVSSSSCSMTAAAGSRVGTDPFTVGFARSSCWGSSASKSIDFWKEVGFDFTISEGSASSRTSACMELARAAILGL